MPSLRDRLLPRRKSPTVLRLALVLALAVASVGTRLLLAPATSADEPPRASDVDFATMVREGKRPRLAVLIVVDQLRADYLHRFLKAFLPPVGRNGEVGGFRHLMTEGSWFVDARHEHFPTYTSPGHAAVSTGGSPYKTGIVGNEWLDRATLRPVLSIDDPRGLEVVPKDARARAAGPGRLRSSTLGDELKLATGGASKVVSISLKDRAAVLLAGHSADACVWFDEPRGRWASSSAYCPDRKLPAWIERLNAEEMPSRTRGTVWSPSVPRGLLAHTLPVEPGELFSTGGFRHEIGSDCPFSRSPSANAFVFETARRAVTEERLGQRGEPDLLLLNLATNDYCGHAYGPSSAEVADLTVATDRQLADFLGFLRNNVPGGLGEVVVALTGDHGVAPIPETALAFGLPGRRILPGRILSAARAALAELDPAFEDKDALGFAEPGLYFRPEAVARASENGVSRAALEDSAARAIASLDGVFARYTRTALETGNLPRTELARLVANGFHPACSGDVVVVFDQHVLGEPRTADERTSHGTPFAYDTRVPILIAGAGIRPGVHADPVSPLDIAPTLAALLGIVPPSACDGRILSRALR